MIKFILSKTVTLISLILVLSISGCSYWGSAPTLKWAFGIGGPEADWGKDIVSDKDGNIIILGHVEGGVDLDPGANEKYLNSGRREDDFLASYSSTGQLN